MDQTEGEKELVQPDPLELKAEASQEDRPESIPVRKVLIMSGSMLFVLVGWWVVGTEQARRFIGLTLAGVLLTAALIFAGYLAYRWWSFRLQAYTRQRALQARTARQERLDSIVQVVADDIARASATPLNWYHAIPEARPDDLSVWFVFETEDVFAQAVAAGDAKRIDAMTRSALYRGGYPVDAIDDVFVGFKTHEALERELGGDYRALLEIKSSLQR